MFNGKKFGKRPVAVDWAVSKKIYASGSKFLAPSEEANFSFQLKFWLCTRQNDK